ncbi:MAG: YkgJ family cysteine cluster protein [archaeon]
MSVSISPPADAITACQKCGECCKRYAISALPHEIERQATFFKLDVANFTTIYTRLLVQFLPYSSGDHPLALHTSMIPKPVWDQLKKAGFDAEYAMVLPMIGFKKQEYCVFFDTKTFGCTMHAVKPMQCNLFPFTSLKDNEDYAKAYDFCELSKISSPTDKTKEIQKYHWGMWKLFFDKVAFEGMHAASEHWPETGDIVFNGQKIWPVTKNELSQWLSLAKNKKIKESSE